MAPPQVVGRLVRSSLQLVRSWDPAFRGGSTCRAFRGGFHPWAACRRGAPSALGACGCLLVLRFLEASDCSCSFFVAPRILADHTSESFACFTYRPSVTARSFALARSLAVTSAPARRLVRLLSSVAVRFSHIINLQLHYNCIYNY